MIKYMRFQLYLAAKKVSTYLIPAIFVLVVFFSTGMPILIGGGSLETMANLSITMILPFVVSAIFVAMKAINIFKTPEEDGSELLVVSKPIIRVKIVTGKFLALFTLIVCFSIFVMIGAAFITLVDNDMSSSARAKFVFSFGIGSLIIQTLLSTIIVFFASVLSKVWTMVLSIFLPIVATIMSMIMVSVTTAEGEGIRPNNISYISKSGSSKNYNFYNGNPKTNVGKNVNSEYSTIAYFDIWGQLSTFYTMFNNKGVMSHWESVAKRPKKEAIKDIYNFSGLDNKTYYALNIDQITLSNKEAKKIEATTDKFIQNYWSGIKGEIESYVHDGKERMTYKDFSDNNYNTIQTNDVLEFINNKIKKRLHQGGLYAPNIKINAYSHYSLNKISQMYTTHIVSKLLQDKGFGSWSKDIKDQSDKNYEKNHSSTTDGGYTFDYSYYFMDEKQLNEGLGKGSDNVHVIELKPYISRGVIIALWIFITLLIGSLVFFRYMRRDFK